MQNVDNPNSICLIVEIDNEDGSVLIEMVPVNKLREPEEKGLSISQPISAQNVQGHDPKCISDLVVSCEPGEPVFILNYSDYTIKIYDNDKGNKVFTKRLEKLQSAKLVPILQGDKQGVFEQIKSRIPALIASIRDSEKYQGEEGKAYKGYCIKFFELLRDKVTPPRLR